MSDLSALIPIAVMMGILLSMTVGIAVIFKTFYKKVAPGEVIILNTLEAKPRIIKTGTLVFPIIYRASSISLNTQAIKIESEILHKINELYNLKLQEIAVQVQDTDNSILLAHSRINDSESSYPLISIVNQAVQEALLTQTDYQEFKNQVGFNLSKVGYELVV
jgi:uncharacterized membrane protein YqiK